jgi:hypothetical protein
MRTIEKLIDKINDATVMSEGASFIIKLVGVFALGFVVVWALGSF